VSEITDDNSGAYAKIIKKTRRLKKEGEEAKSGERVLKSRVIETSTLPKHYDSSCDDFVYQDEVGSVAGSEIQTTVLKEVVPPPLVGLTPLNYEETLMLKEAFFTNTLAEKAVRDEERRRVATRRAEYTNRGKGVTRVVELTTHLSAADKTKEAAAKAVSALTDVEQGHSPDRRHSTPVGAVSDSVSAEATRRATVAALRPSLLQELSYSHSMVTSGYVDELDSEPLEDSPEDIEEGKGEAKQQVLRRNTLGGQSKASQERKANELHQGKRGSVQYISQTVEESGRLRKSLTNTEGSSSKLALQQANYSPVGKRPQETSPAAWRASQAMLEQNKPSPSQSAVRRSSAMTVLERSPVLSRRSSQAVGQELQSGSRTPQKQDLPPKGHTSEIGGRRHTVAQENLTKVGSKQDPGRRPSQGTVKSNSSLSSEKALSKTEADVEGSQEHAATTPSRASKEGGDQHQRLPERKRKSIFDPEKEPNKIHEEESQSSHSSDYFTEEEEVASLTNTRTSVPSTLTGAAKNEMGSIRRNTAKEKLLTPYRERVQKADDAKSKRNPVETMSQRGTQPTEESAQKLSQSGSTGPGTLSRRNTLAVTSSAKSDDLRRVSSLKVVEESKKVPTVRRGTVAASNLLTRGPKRQPKPDDKSPIQALDYDSDHSQGSNELNSLNQSLHSQKSLRSQRSGRVDPDKSIDSSSSKSPPDRLHRNASIGSDSSEGQLNASAFRKRHSVAVTNSAFGSSSFSGLKLLAEQAIRNRAESPTSSRDHSVELKTPPSRAGRNSVMVTRQVSSYDKTPHMYSAKSGRTVQGISNKPQQPMKAGRVKELTKEDKAAIVIQRYFRSFYEKRGFDSNKALQTEENSVVRLEKMLALLVDDRVIKGMRLMGGFVEYLEERGLNSLKL
jgi:hypothetical protein